MVDDFDPFEGEGESESEMVHGAPPIGDEPRIGQSVTFKANTSGIPADMDGEGIEQIIDVLGPLARNDDGDATSWIVTTNTGEQIVELQHGRWVRIG